MEQQPLRHPAQSGAPDLDRSGRQTAHQPLTEGRGQGLAEGRAEAASEVASLMALLLGAERLDDARRAAVDESYRDELMREFGISQAE